METEFEFELPRGYVDRNGDVHKRGTMRLATAADEILPMRDPRVQQNAGYLTIIILSRVITRGLVYTGRSCQFRIALEDKPGQLLGVSRIISECGGNVIRVHYEQSDPNMAITSCFINFGLETRDFAQIEQIRSALTAAGFKLA